MVSDYNAVNKHYNSIATYYGINDKFSSILYIYTTRVKRVIELVGNLDLDGLKVLSVGCGPAPIASQILEKKGRFYGIDLSQDILHKAKKSHESETLLLSAGDMRQIPFQNESFDLLLCLGPLEYVDDVKLVFEEFSRVMKTGAIAIISMQNKFSPYRLWDRYIYSGFLFNAIRKLGHRSISNKPLENLIPINDLKQNLCRYSFAVTDLIYYNFNLMLKPFDRLFPRLSVMTSGRLEFLYHSKVGFFAADFIITAQKVKQPI